MSFNFNGVNKNKVYMNGVEVTKAYMNGVEFYSSSAVYKLNFDAANQDNIEVSSSFIWNTNSDIDFEIEFETNDTLINTILDIGFSNNPNSGKIRLTYADNTGFAQLLIWRPNDIFANYSLNLGNLSANTKYLLKVNNSEIYLDGVLKGTISSTTFDIDSSIRHRLMFNTNGVIYNYNFNGETFPLNEGSGNTITGDNNTVGTINTSNAAGIAYINANVWEEIV